MSFDALKIAKDSIKDLSPYQPGKPISELTREYGVTDVIKLASNECPLGPSQKVLDAIQQESKNLQFYPDGNAFELKNKIADIKKVSINQITLGNGSDDIFNFILRVFTDKDSEVIVSEYGFAAYAIATKAVGAKLVTAPAKDWGHDLEAMAKAVTSKTKVIFIANPNNPTGTWNKSSDIITLLNSVPKDVIVVVDQAYFEFMANEPAYIDAKNFIKDFPNLIVTYTFSKAYGLAGLRVGYSISTPEVSDLLNRVRLPFNVNALAVKAATIAMDDIEHLEKALDLNKSGLEQLENYANNLGLSYIPSRANFLTIDLGKPALPIYQSLLKLGIIVRPVANYGMPNHLRITVGTKQQIDRCMNAIFGIIENQ